MGRLLRHKLLAMTKKIYNPNTELPNYFREFSTLTSYIGLKNTKISRLIEKVPEVLVPQRIDM